MCPNGVVSQLPRWNRKSKVRYGRLLVGRGGSPGFASGDRCEQVKNNLTSPNVNLIGRYFFFRSSPAAKDVTD